MRVLMSEGSSLSARESLTALGLAGHHVAVMDPNPLCLARFSRYCRALYRCPPFGENPEGYLRSVRTALVEGPFDVLYPAHEQAYLFARFPHALPPGVRVALPSFDAMERLQSKIGLAGVLEHLGLPTPPTVIVRETSQLRAAAASFPVYLKTAFGTAHAGTYLVINEADLEGAVAAVADTIRDGVVVQAPVAGALERAQAVFAAGNMVAFHACRQVAEGLGGGDFIKESVSRPGVREDVRRLGEYLGWHGGLSMDYVLDGADVPTYIDSNPRLAEIGNALLSGVNLADALVRVSADMPVPYPASRVGVRSHMAIQGLLRGASRRGARRDVCTAIWDLLSRRGVLRGSHEELTPVTDALGLVPVMGVASKLLLMPSAATDLARGTVTAYAASRKVIDFVHTRHG